MGDRKAEITTTPSVDIKLMLERVQMMDAQLSILRQELVAAIGGPRVALQSSSSVLEDGLSFATSVLAVEILDDSGTVVESPGADDLKIKNITGESVKVSQGPAVTAQPGVLQIVIPNEETKGVKRKPRKALKTAFVEYRWFDPCPAPPGTLCIGQWHRYLLNAASDGGGGSSADATGNLLILRKKSSGGFELTAG
jgi:hypothetical protein